MGTPEPCPLCRSTNIGTDRDDPQQPITAVWCKDCGCTVDDCTDCSSEELPWDRWNARVDHSADMLEALYQYVSDLRYPPQGDSIQRRIERAEAAIAKATGKAGEA